MKRKKNEKRKQRIKPCPVKRKNTIRKGIVHMYIYTYEVTTSKGLKTNNKSFSITATARSLTVGCRVSRGSCSRKSTLRRTKPCEETLSALFTPRFSMEDLGEILLPQSSFPGESPE